MKDLPGFGIGLYLVREILSGEGGYVKIKENPEGGTIVQMYLSRFQSDKKKMDNGYIK